MYSKKNKTEIKSVAKKPAKGKDATPTPRVIGNPTGGKAGEATCRR